MAIDFPLSPSLNDVYTFNGKSWRWNGYAWASVGVSGTGGSLECCPIPLATTGATGVASFDGTYFDVAPTGHVAVRTGIKAGNIIVLGQSAIFGIGGTGALPALDGSALTGVDAKYLQGKTPRDITDGGVF